MVLRCLTTLPLLVGACTVLPPRPGLVFEGGEVGGSVVQGGGHCGAHAGVVGGLGLGHGWSRVG